jgi:hypothetical protein
VRVFFPYQHRQHGPCIGITGRLLHRSFQACLRGSVFGWREPREVREAAQHRLVRRQLFGIFDSQRLAHRARQNSVGVGNSRNDPWHQVILQREDFLPAKHSIIRFRPHMSAGGAIHEMHRDPQNRASLAKAATHHIASAKLLADGANVDRLLGKSQSGTPCDHP